MIKINLFSFYVASCWVSVNFCLFTFLSFYFRKEFKVEKFCLLSTLKTTRTRKRALFLSPFFWNFLSKTFGKFHQKFSKWFLGNFIYQQLMTWEVFPIHQIKTKIVCNWLLKSGFWIYILWNSEKIKLQKITPKFFDRTFQDFFWKVSRNDERGRAKDYLG